MTDTQPVGSGFGGRMGFLNPIIGGNGMLIRSSIQSPNFVPGVSGWSINKDGTAQFYGLTLTGGGFIANSDGQFFYQGVPAAGNLILAITGSTASGTDPFGNTYTPGGVSLIAAATATSLFNVGDTSSPPNTLLAIANDGSLSTAGTISADTDLFVAGNSLLNDIMPSVAQGLLARTSVLASALPAPATPVTGEFFLYELGVNIPLTGRECLLVIEPMSIQLSGAGKLRTIIYATSDGSQPTNASPVIASMDLVGNVTANFNMRTGTLVHPFAPPVNGLWRFLVSISTVGTGGAVPTMQMLQLGFNPGTDGYSGSNGRFSVYDMGPTVPNTGRQILTGGSSGSGGGTKNFTTTYQAVASHCYAGSDGTFPNTKINDGQQMTQGGNVGNTFNGKCKTWVELPAVAMQSDLAGATITAVKIYLNNNHSWFNSGMTLAIGYDNKSSFGSTAADPSGVGIDAAETHFNEGQAKWVDVTGQGFGTAFQNGTASNLVLFKNSNNLQYYGYFAGRNQNGPPAVKISYTK